MVPSLVVMFFYWVEWVEGAGTEGASLAGLIGGAVGFAGVLDYGDVVGGGNLLDGVHVSWQSEEVDDMDGPGLRVKTVWMAVVFLAQATA
jgi:hypothetical protein